ncbi:hypothetical protein ACXX82_04765 [Glaciimonas sp. GNP009]|uniref:hypothetical protein n=1 Tax=Glaciimonas sp. Gout2 TaxID=3048625 RepID=UPI002B22AE81|nr:hypothetical protein [Glaciimonas sp. Gout2]
MQIRRTMIVVALSAGLLAGCQKKLTPLPETTIPTQSRTPSTFSPSLAITPAMPVTPALPIVPVAPVTPAIPTTRALGESK